MARGEEHGATGGQRELRQFGAAPFVIAAVADHELNEIMSAEARELFVTITPFLARAGRLDIDDLDHSWVDLCQRHRAARLERHPQARIAQRGEKRDATLLRERFASGNADVTRRVFTHPCQDRRQLPPLPSFEGISGVAVLAPQRASREPHEHRRYARGVSLSLQRVEDLGNPQARHAGAVTSCRELYAPWTIALPALTARTVPGCGAAGPRRVSRNRCRDTSSSPHRASPVRPDIASARPACNRA